mgnify:CR=1 FL=1
MKMLKLLKNILILMFFILPDTINAKAKESNIHK